MSFRDFFLSGIYANCRGASLQKNTYPPTSSREFVNKSAQNQKTLVTSTESPLRHPERSRGISFHPHSNAIGGASPQRSVRHGRSSPARGAGPVEIWRLFLGGIPSATTVLMPLLTRFYRATPKITHAVARTRPAFVPATPAAHSAR